MDISRCDKILQLALLEAGRQDDFTERELGPIHLLKYVYLADLDYAERHQGETFTGARWIFFHYGPWAQEVFQRIEPALAAIHADKQVIASTRYDDDFVRWKMTDDNLYLRLERELPHAVVSSVRRNVRKYGRDTAELLHHVYVTRPMRTAVPGSELVFYVAEPTTAEAADAPSRQPTVREQKKRKTRFAEARADIKAKLAARRAERATLTPAVQPPRYDEVFFQGLKWLDEEGTGGAGEFEGEAKFDDEVWTSETRGEPRE